MPDRIVIDFEDEKEDKGNAERAEDQNRIIIDLGEEEKNTEAEIPVMNYEEIIVNSKINSCFRGNSYLNYSYDSELQFPEGIEQGFRKKFGLYIKDSFFNSILENNKFIILTSKNGNIYFVDRYKGSVKDKIFLEYESFEKTGLVYENTIFINSLKKIFLINDKDEDKLKPDEIYFSTGEFFIWSNLNRYKDFLLFIEYSPLKKKAFLKILDLMNSETIYDFSFDVNNFVSDKICIADGCAYILFDSSFLVYDIEKKFGEMHIMEIKTNENSFIFYLNYRIYITSHLNELYYLDIPPVNYRFRFSGIKNNYINSVGGFADNIFMGTLDGWKYYKSSGLAVYNYDDEYENKIEAICKNILAVSQKNKIVFCNLNRFQEAEGYVISSKEKDESVEIISAVFSENEIFVLTNNGILDVFTNDKLNIHL